MATIKGKWKWNSTIDNLLQGGGVASGSINFVSNSESFSQLKIETYYAIPAHVEIYYDAKKVTIHDVNGSGNDYEAICEFDKKYRIMDFGETEQLINDELYDFIAANATEYYTVADKALTIVKNMPKVYEAGRDKGYTEGHAAGYEEGFNAGGYNEGYNSGFEAGRTEGFDEGYDHGEADGYQQGKQDEHKVFWDAYITSTLNNWQYAFYSQRWNDKNFYPTKNLKPTGVFSYGFSSHQITNLKQRLIDCGVTLDTSAVRSGNYQFCFCSLLTHLPTLSFVGLSEQITHTFADDRKLVEIEKIILKDDGSTTFNYWFRECYELTTIAFEGVISRNLDFQWSTKLSKTSIENIINHLAEETIVRKTLTLSTTAVENAFDISAVDGDGDGVVDWWVGNGLDYWLTLINGKSNWNFAFV